MASSAELEQVDQIQPILDGLQQVLQTHGARCAWAMAVYHAVGISRQRNSGYRLSRVNMAQGLSTPDPFLSPTHLSTIRRSRATTSHYTHHQVCPMVSRNTILIPSLGLHIGPACEAGLSAGMRRERVPPQIRKKDRKTDHRIHPSASKIYLVFFWKCQLYQLILQP